MITLPQHTTEEWRKYNILIVDDEPRILNRLEAQLSSAGFSILKATSGEEALQILDQQEIHVVLCDQKMPKGMTGTAFLCKARKKKPHLIGIILSAFNKPKYLLSAINEADALYYLLKPWNKKDLITSITRALQLCHTRILEAKWQAQILRYAQNGLTEMILESDHHRRILQETAQSLSVFSDVAGQLGGELTKRLQEKPKTMADLQSS